MDYKSVFPNLCLELQQNRSWIKGLCKNPQKRELIHWRQCLLSGGTEACSRGLLVTPACIRVTATMSGVLTWHGFRQNSQKTECVFTCCPTGGRKEIVCIYGLRSEGVNQDHFHFSLTPLSGSRTNCSSFLSKILAILKSGCLRYFTIFVLSRTHKGQSCGVSWPSGLAYRTQVLVLAAECGFESRPWHLCPWARHLIIIASLHPGVKWVPARAELID